MGDDAAAICLAIGGVLTVAIAAVHAGVGLHPPRHARRLRVPARVAHAVVAVPARAGPAELQVFRR